MAMDGIAGRGGGKASMGRRLAAETLVALSAAVAVAMGAAFAVLYATLRSEYLKDQIAYVDQMRESLNGTFSNMELSLQGLLADARLQGFVPGDPAKERALYGAFNDVVKRSSFEVSRDSLRFRNDLIDDVFLVADGGVFAGDSARYRDPDALRGHPAAVAAKYAEPGTPLWSHVAENAARRGRYESGMSFDSFDPRVAFAEIALAGKAPGLAGGPGPGVVAVSVGVERLAGLLIGLDRPRDSTYLILDGRGVAVSSNRPSLLLRSFPGAAVLGDGNWASEARAFRLRLEDGEKTVIHVPLKEGTSLSLACIVNWSGFGVRAGQLGLYFAAGSLLFLAVAVAFALLRLGRVVRPLSDVTAQLERMDDGAPGRLAPPEGDSAREVARFVDAFNGMSDRAEAMREKLDLERRAKAVLERQVVQQQIDPHFLYNTLDCLRWLALSGDPDDKPKVASMVDALSRFFKIGLSDGRPVVSLREELEHVRSYLQVIGYRYGDSVASLVEVDGAALDALVPKVVLQPLVENAVRHGLREVPGGGFVRISGGVEGADLVLRVVDNGVGIDRDELDSINDALEAFEWAELVRGGSKEWFGVLNTHARLVSVCGAGAGLRFESSKGRGTKVTLRLPYRTAGSSAP